MATKRASDSSPSLYLLKQKAKVARTSAAAKPDVLDSAWTGETPCVELFKRISGFDSKDESKVKDFLAKRNVETLFKLREKLDSANFTGEVAVLLFQIGLSERSNLDGWKEKLDKLDKPESREKTDELLDEKLNGVILTHSFQKPKHRLLTREIFSDQLEHIKKQRENVPTGRNEPFLPIIVSGSSGAGKTTFAGGVLSQFLFETKKQMFCVFVKRDIAVPETPEDKADPSVNYDANKGDPPAPLGDLEDDNEGKEDFSGVDRMVNRIIEHIYDLFKQKGIPQTEGDPPLQREMILIIDEMGLDDDLEYIGTRAKLEKIRSILEERIATRVQLVVVGTGVDGITTKLNTDKDAVKINIKPWSIQSLVALAYNMCLPQNLMHLLREPVLTDLGTNARAAVFLILELIKRGNAIVDTYQMRSAQIDALVSQVAYDYIDSNGLEKCTYDQRRLVAKFVLETLQCTKKWSVTNPYQDIVCSDPKVKSAAVGLMDFHIETRDGTAFLRERESYAVTITPAVTIVLSSLMGAIETFSGSWEGLERIGALDALATLYVESEVQEIHGMKQLPPMSIVRASCPFPATSGKNKFKAPLVDRGQVLLNGTGAPHADSISLYQFGQFKKSESELADLDIWVELGKMGLMDNSWYEEKKAQKQREAQAKAKANEEEEEEAEANVKAKTAKGAQAKAKANEEEEEEAEANVKAKTAKGDNSVVPPEEPYLASRWMTKILIEQWKSPTSSPARRSPKTGEVSTPNQPANDGLKAGSTRHMYPFSQLFRKEEKATVLKIDVDAEKARDFATQPIKEVLPKNQKIKVVFATNAFGFKIKNARGLTIRRNDVDNNGVLEAEAAAKLNSAFTSGSSVGRLPAHVEVKFLICGR